MAAGLARTGAADSSATAPAASSGPIPATTNVARQPAGGADDPRSQQRPGAADGVARGVERGGARQSRRSDAVDQQLQARHGPRQRRSRRRTAARAPRRSHAPRRRRQSWRSAEHGARNIEPPPVDAVGRCAQQRNRRSRIRRSRCRRSSPIDPRSNSNPPRSRASSWRRSAAERGSRPARTAARRRFCRPTCRSGVAAPPAAPPRKRVRESGGLERIGHFSPRPAPRDLRSPPPRSVASRLYPRRRG